MAVLLAILFFIPFDLSAAPLSALEGLESLRRTFGGLQDFKADLTQEKQLSIMKRKLIMHGEIRFKTPDSFMMELDQPYKSKTLLKDNLLLQRVGKDGELQKVLLPPEQGLSRWMASVANPVNKLPEGMDVKADKTGSQTTVTISPKRGQLKEITVVLHEDGTVRRLLLLERNGDKTTMQFSNMRRNIGLKESEFRLD